MIRFNYYRRKWWWTFCCCDYRACHVRLYLISQTATFCSCRPHTITSTAVKCGSWSIGHERPIINFLSLPFRLLAIQAWITYCMAILWSSIQVERSSRRPESTKKYYSLRLVRALRFGRFAIYRHLLTCFLNEINIGSWYVVSLFGRFGRGAQNPWRVAITQGTPHRYLCKIRFIVNHFAHRTERRLSLSLICFGFWLVIKVLEM